MRKWLSVLGIVLVGSTALAGTPTIRAILPDTGSAGDSVWIIGRDLAARGAETTVTFDGIAADAMHARPWSIVAKVPAGTALGEIDVVVTVTPDEGEPAVSEPATFTVVERGVPEIEAIEPVEGYPGTPVTITGTNFGRLLSRVTVKLGEAETMGCVWGGRIYARVPRDLPAGEVSVTVIVGDAESNVVSFTVKAFPDPVIADIVPAEGPVGTIVKISGENFTTVGCRCGELMVLFGEAEARVLYRRSDVIAAVVPAGLVPDTTVDVTVDVDGRVAVLEDGFTVTPPPPPSIESIAPDHGTPGTIVRIEGQNLGGPDSEVVVTFAGGEAAEKVRVNTRGTVILAVVPVGAETGAIAVTVDGADATAPEGGVVFTVDPIPQPVIDEIAPAEGPVGTRVVIEGSNFSAGVLKPSVTFGGIEAKAYLRPGWSWGRHPVAPAIVAIVPEGLEPGETPVDVVVTVGDVASDPGAFTVTAPPAEEETGEETGE
ncbi:MAG: IPT/TIG domain-containing protein [Planctomycetes bacterium]|nr:IPT/TIG domain-containing protein [Planctomycetota bacterium]